MRFLCLVHFDPSKMESMSVAGQQDIDRRSIAYDRELERRGNDVLSQAVQGGDSAVLVRVRQGRVSTADGPYIEIKEQMAGFILIDARDLNEAIGVAAGVPLAELGTIEVRPEFVIPTPPAP